MRQRQHYGGGYHLSLWWRATGWHYDNKCEGVVRIDWWVCMAQPNIVPHKVTKPIALLAVWFAALVIIVGIFLYAARMIDEPLWLKQILVISAILFVPLFVSMVYWLQTKYRPEMQEDPYYSEYLKRLGPVFRNFKPENIDTKIQRERAAAPLSNESWEEREKRRCKIYEDQKGLFLVHSWRPSKTPGQVADIVISLAQHGNGPLIEGKVKNF